MCPFEIINKCCSVLHPFILTSHLNCAELWGLDPVPVLFGREAEYSHDRLPVYHRANTNRHTISVTLTFTPTGNTEFAILKTPFGRLTAHQTRQINSTLKIM